MGAGVLAGLDVGAEALSGLNSGTGALSRLDSETGAPSGLNPGTVNSCINKIPLNVVSNYLASPLPLKMHQKECYRCCFCQIIKGLISCYEDNYTYKACYNNKQIRLKY